MGGGKTDMGELGMWVGIWVTSFPGSLLPPFLRRGPGNNASIFDRGK